MNKLNELETLRMIYLLQLLSITKSTLGILDAEVDKTPSNLSNIKVKLEDYPIDFDDLDEVLEEL
ncbi:MAG: hypothetical protein IJD87_05670 [Turicibacter sp.]|nr:hypothetical protein [Turicibacter sp.]